MDFIYSIVSNTQYCQIKILFHPPDLYNTCPVIIGDTAEGIASAVKYVIL